jgi:hypothetical protein
MRRAADDEVGPTGARVETGLVSGIGEHDLAAVILNVGHEEPADQVPIVPEPVPFRTGRQQQARVLNSAGGEYEHFCPNRKTMAVERRYARLEHFPAGFVRNEPHDIGVQVDGELPGGAQGWRIDLGKARGWAELQYFAPKVLAVKGGRHFGRVDTPVIGGVIKRAELADLLGTPIPGIQIGAIERPTAERNSVPALEVDRIERQTPSTPVIGCPAKIAQPAGAPIEVVASCIGVPPLSRLATLNLALANSLARVIPAAPPPMIQTSVCSTFPAG